MRVKSEKRRLAILEAGKSVFLERGYDAASMAEVAVRAGGSKQTLYHYFGSKEALFVAVMLEKGAAQVGPLFDSFHQNQDLRAALADFAIKFLRFIAQDEILGFRRVIYAEGPRSDLGKLFFENGRKPGLSRLAEDFAVAMDEGRMRRADPWRAVVQFHALIEAGPFQRLLEGAIASAPDADLVEAAAAAVETFARAYDIGSVALSPASDPA
ncbi:TetR/AcrR family transcriptional regulator [Caulobacter soli]|uniref:TetR/AcrR family transcriptional regulator n=1 Tax=Caulobacter soli TaxID=2708539 RepID=UPI0013ED0075|nr:TetR/AcrR family transcriptional regulator [Caulobacter soli]